MVYTIEAYLAVVAVAALLIGALLLPAALLVLVHEAAHQIRALPAEFQLTHHAHSSAAPAAHSRD